MVPSDIRAGLRFSRAETKGLSRDSRDVRSRSKNLESQFTDAAALTSFVSRSASSKAARGKPRKTIASRSTRKTSWGLSASMNRRATGSFDCPRKTSRVGRSTGPAMETWALLNSPASRQNRNYACSAESSAAGLEQLRKTLQQILGTFFSLADPDVRQPQALIQQFPIGGKDNNRNRPIQIPDLTGNLQPVHVRHPIVDYCRMHELRV